MRGFRPSTPEDAEAIIALCSEVLQVPPGSPVLWLPHLNWKYWSDQPGWNGPRSYVVSEGRQIVAHAGVVPASFARDGRTYTLVQLIDWAASPTHVGAGVSLLKHVARLADGVINVRASEIAQRIFRRLAYRPLGETTRYVLRLPAVRDFGGRAALAADVRMHAPGAFDRPAAHPLESAVSRGGAIVLRRSLDRLAALSLCPAAPMSYGEVLREGSLRGTFSICEAAGQLRLVDAWADTGRDDAAWEVVLAAVLERSAAHPAATELVTQTNDPLQERALLAAGFAPAGTDPLSVLADRNVVPDGAYVRHQLIDSDLAYLHHNVPEVWAPEH
jgi:hypothetical protein